MKLLVRNLSRSTTEQELRILFSAHGNVTECTLVLDQATAKSKGFGFVEMSDGAEKAIAELNDHEIEGRKLVVNESRPRESR